MFIIPVGNRVNWKKPPIATLFIILVNCFIFFFLQSGDELREKKAHEYYFSSELPTFELPHYATFLTETDRSKEAAQFKDLLLKKNVVVLEIMERDTKFMRKLIAGRIITPDVSEYGAWKLARKKFISLQSFTSHFIFKVDDPSPLSAFSSAFLHSGFDHLFGNMVVLFLVGFLVEAVLGKLLFSLAYCIAALVAAYTFSLTAEGHSLLGASGAIAGVMGLYTVIFGLRKIDFFYSLGFYFDYIRAPAIALLPLWLGNELYQFFSEHGSHIAYMAHFGGLLSGALMAYIYHWKHRDKINTHHQVVESKELDDKAFQRGVNYLGEMEFQKALSIFKALLENHPDDIKLLQLSYRAAKADPSSEDYHRIALRLLSMPTMDAFYAAQVHLIFREYLDCAKPSHRLGNNLIGQLSKNFANTGYCEDAEKLSNVLLQIAPQHSELPAVLLALARVHFRQQRKDKFTTTLELLKKKFPSSPEAIIANDMLRLI
jgi:membrane associated rhomboid family serine protease